MPSWFSPSDAAVDGLDRLELTPRASVVVATHGDLDEEALARVLATEVGYVSLLASRKRAAVIIETLRRQGVPPERLDRLKAPAGLDIGAVTPEEIAVSILAEIIHRHRSEKVARVETDTNQTSAAAIEAKDPICGMLVAVGGTRYRSEVSGQVVYFCCLRCKETFDTDPQKYIVGLDR